MRCLRLARRGPYGRRHLRCGGCRPQRCAGAGTHLVRRLRTGPRPHDGPDGACRRPMRRARSRPRMTSTRAGPRCSAMRWPPGVIPQRVGGRAPPWPEVRAAARESSASAPRPLPPTPGSRGAVMGRRLGGESDRADSTRPGSSARGIVEAVAARPRLTIERAGKGRASPFGRPSRHRHPVSPTSRLVHCFPPRPAKHSARSSGPAPVPAALPGKACTGLLRRRRCRSPDVEGGHLPRAPQLGWLAYRLGRQRDVV